MRVLYGIITYNKNMSHHSFDFKGRKFDLVLEKYIDLKEINPHTKKEISQDIHRLLANCWGSFPEDFVEQHIFFGDKMIVAIINGKCIGLCVMSIKEVFGLKIHYIEFLLVDKDFQQGGLGSFLSFKILKDELVNNFAYLLLGKSLEIFFITPNIRVLSHATKFASFVYPNPYLANNDGQVELADQQTWEIALELLKRSDNPYRDLNREGLVLTGSYSNTPWLIYNNDNAPWHSNDKINLFAKRYLGYHSGQDKELMVRLNINLFSVIKYLFKK